MNDQADRAPHAPLTGPALEGRPLRLCVQEALEGYFADLEGYTPGELYQMVLAEVERPLLETVLRHTGGNQTRAAELLGINRGTLRKKLRQYGIE